MEYQLSNLSSKKNYIFKSLELTQRFIKFSTPIFKAYLLILLTFLSLSSLKCKWSYYIAPTFSKGITLLPGSLKTDPT